MEKPDVTRLLEAAGGGDRAALDRLYAVVYDELHRIAASRMRRESRAVTLQPTVLVNEAWLKLAEARSGFQNRAHFFVAAADSMRRILVDHARARHAQKRGGGFERVTLSGIDVPAGTDEIDVLELDDVLEKLRAERPRLAELVMLRFFAGLGIEETADALGISVATANRDWTFARAWLREALDAAHRS